MRRFFRFARAHDFFQASYALKEALKNDKESPFYANKDPVETFCKSAVIALSLDIANQHKHAAPHRNASRVIGDINVHVHMLSPDNSPDHTELTIEIDGKKEDCFLLVKDVLAKWEGFIRQHNL